jgi:hypothetical protein
MIILLNRMRHTNIVSIMVLLGNLGIREEMM